MAVKLRMTRMGRRHRPFFRINAVESRSPRDGKILEKLGHYDPVEKDPQKQIVLNLERVRHWLDNGAIPSDTVSQILLRCGIKNKYAEEKTARRARAKAQARAKGKFFTKAEKIALEKAAQEEGKKAKSPAQAKPEPQVEPEAEAKPEAETKVEEKAEAEPEAEAKPEAEEQPASDEKTDTSDEN